MASYTPNYNLKKPAGGEYYDVADQNGNMDLIDTALKSHDTTLSGKAGKSEAVKNITRSGLTFTATKADNSTFTFTQQDTTYSDATTSTHGLMSTADKTKLNGIANNANNYSLPLAANGTRGGIQVGYTQSGKNYPVQLSSEKAYVNVPWTDTTYNDATTSTHGLMSTADKTKLNGIAAGANNYSLPMAANGTRGGVQLGYSTNAKNYAVQASSEKLYVNVPWTDTVYTLPLAANGTRGGVQLGYTTSGKNYAVQQSGEKLYVNVPWENTTYSAATTSANGLMSSSDKTKLNGIASGAQVNNLATISIDVNFSSGVGTISDLAGKEIVSAMFASTNENGVIIACNGNKISGFEFLSGGGGVNPLVGTHHCTIVYKV